MSEIAINLVYEDDLSCAVLCKLLKSSQQDFIIGQMYCSHGFGYIKKSINGFNNAAKGMPWLVLTDLDRCECPPILISEWLGGNKHHNLIFRVAVRQVESWVLGCRPAFAKFLGVKEELIPRNVDEISNAKDFLVDLARRSHRKKMRSDIVPEEGSTAKVGPDYNGRLIYFVENLWDPNRAKEYSPSLLKAIEVLDEFEPIFESPS